ncbi:MAG: SAM-dependent DNA methyltransferase [Methanobrevibacter olleyae]|uniref:site-specific DNA-methyltransferase (adenine-specific) n=1 Tax=Methanobrevibacter olleyae TaxID=294671 RepID=A0A8T3VP30_METOL|nr:SAM-dependent DNA methyltransferase [Methanobrevibacter olleyae]
MVSERTTDDIVRELLKDAEIDYDEQISSNPEIDEALNGATKSIESSSGENKGFPEFIAQVNEFIIVIEDKKDSLKQVLYLDDNHNKLDLSTENAIKNYAENGALHYAKHIVENSSYKKVFAFGCSGTDNFTIRPIFVDETDYKLLEEVEDFENFSEDNINDYYREEVLELPSQKDIELEEVIKKSKELNDHLRNYGQLGDTQKPLVVSAILLALNEGLNLDDLKGKPKGGTDGKKIYEYVSDNLESSEVGDKKRIILNQFTLIKDDETLNTIEPSLKKTPLKYFTEFIKNKIFPSITTVNVDILGYFYSEFIKYSGVDGSSLGIVLTPKHITELFCELLEIKPSDKIFDPCCGTGSFLIAGMNKMIAQTNDDDEKRNIKLNNLHGIELRPHLFSIATTNMVLRGDGKSNLKLGNFFRYDSNELKKENYTIGLMNPPYSQGGELSEMNFIKHLLDSLGENGKCAVIVPQSVMVGTSDDDKKLKKQILKEHTLEGVITLNPNHVFRRRGVNPVIAIFTAHNSHPPEKRSKFINFKDDGYRLKKHTGIVETDRVDERRKHLLQCWRDEIDAESKFMVKSKVKDDDEWLHSYYYFNDEIPSKNELENVMADYLTFEFDFISHGKEYLFEDD